MRSDMESYSTEEVIDAFFNNENNSAMLLRMLNQKSVSLRLLDFLCTCYSKENHVQTTHCYDLHAEYQSWLKCFQKSMLDPFRRSKIIDYSITTKKRTISTTYGQLNFARFVIVTGALQWLENSDNKERVMKDMLNRNRGKKVRKAALGDCQGNNNANATSASSGFEEKQGVKQRNCGIERGCFLMETGVTLVLDPLKKQ